MKTVAKILIAVIVIAIAALYAGPRIAGAFDSDDKNAQRFADAVHRAQEQTSDVRDSLRNVGVRAAGNSAGRSNAASSSATPVPTPTLVAVTPRPGNPMPDSGVSLASLPAHSPNSAGNIEAEMPNPYRPGTEAYELNRLYAEITDGQNPSLNAQEAGRVYADYRAKYETVTRENIQLKRNIRQTHEYAAKYFEHQRNRIAEINTAAANGARIQAAMRQTYRSQYQSYQEWQAAARKVESQADAIQAELDNMNSYLEFSDAAAQFGQVMATVPKVSANTVALFQELDLLEEAADRLNADIAGSAAANSPAPTPTPQPEGG